VPNGHPRLLSGPKMKNRVYFILPILLIVVFVLAFLLRGTVQQWIIIPLAKFIWLVKGYYGAFSQVVYWIVALVFAGIVAILNFRLSEWTGKSQTGQRRSLPGSVRERSFLKNFGQPDGYVPSLPGPVREMSFWIRRKKGGVYPKWHLAHLLAELALDILDRRGMRQKHSQLLTGPDWTPPPDVKHYLDAALTTNYIDYPKPRRYGTPPPTPFDQDLEPVIKYLESLLESEHDHNS
jgi:hypothetical protein